MYINKLIIKKINNLKCEVECAYKTRNIFSNGSYNKTALAEMVNDKFNGSLTNWSSLFKIAFDKCEKDGKIN